VCIINTSTEYLKEKKMNELLVQAEQEMKRLKMYFPYRVVWAAINESTKEVLTGASPTKRQPNSYARKGYQVYVLD
jgi:hypothetical protein